MKKLPISYDNIPNGDCWTFNKLLVIKTSPKADIWLSGHLDIYLDENYYGKFGDDEPYKMSYYDNILSMNRIKICDTHPESLVKKIISKIENDKYILIFLNAEKIIKKEDVGLEKLRGILIYGYDDEKKCFICAMITQGRLKETELTYEIVTSAYRDVYEGYKIDVKDVLSKQNYFFAITEMDIKNNYENDNWVYDMKCKLSREAYGKRIIEERYCENKNIIKERTIYKGLACVNGIESYLKKKGAFCSFNQTELNKLSETFKKMYDHRQIILSSMKYFINIFGTTNDNNLKNIAYNYQNHISTMQIAYLLLCKYAQSNDESIYESIIKKLDNQYELEHEDLESFIQLMCQYNCEDSIKK